MISEQAKSGIDRIFAQAAQSNLLLDASCTIKLESLRANEPGAAVGDRMIVLTIASYHFRLLVIFHLDADPAFETYFSGASDDSRSLEAKFGEIGNLCCGAMKRDLGQYFSHTGMSTPAVLDGSCLAFLSALKPAHVSRHRVVINSTVKLHVTLCLCAYAPIDFCVHPHAVVEETGVLELF